MDHKFADQATPESTSTKPEPDSTAPACSVAPSCAVAERCVEQVASAAEAPRAIRSQTRGLVGQLGKLNPSWPVAIEIVLLVGGLLALALYAARAGSAVGIIALARLVRWLAERWIPRNPQCRPERKSWLPRGIPMLWRSRNSRVGSADSSGASVPRNRRTSLNHSRRRRGRRERQHGDRV